MQKIFTLPISSLDRWSRLCTVVGYAKYLIFFLLFSYPQSWPVNFWSKMTAPVPVFTSASNYRKKKNKKLKIHSSVL